MRLALTSLPEDSTPAEILGTLPVAVSALLRRRQGNVPLAPEPARATAADLLRMTHGAGVAPAMAEALDTYFVTVIDNGLNTSAFTARVIASSRASLVSAALGAYCAFTGPLHGGAPAPTLDMLDEAAESGDVMAWAKKKLAGGERLMGFATACSGSATREPLSYGWRSNGWERASSRPRAGWLSLPRSSAASARRSRG